MPNRVIKQSLLESEKVSGLNDFQFRVWVGLILNADDRGHGDARSAILKAHIFPLRDRVTNKDIDAAMQALAAAGCVSLYKVGGKPYYEFPNWSKHQQIKNVKPKYPCPEDGEYIQFAEIRRNSQKFAEIRSEFPPEYNTIQYNQNTNTNPNTNPNTNICASGDARLSASTISQEFEQLWSMHPKRRGDKKKASESYEKARKNGATFEEVKAGLESYIQYVKREKPEDHYILMAATWFNQHRWKDDYSASINRPLTTADIAQAIDLSDF